MPQPQPDYRIHLECQTNGPTGGKFWIAEVFGSKATVRWGPVGRTGQSKDYLFGSSSAALSFVLDKEDEKRGKRYYEVSRQRAPIAAAKPKPAAPEPQPVQSIDTTSSEALSWDF